LRINECKVIFEDACTLDKENSLKYLLMDACLIPSALETLVPTGNFATPQDANNYPLIQKMLSEDGALPMTEGSFHVLSTHLVFK
jgi:hypothetical protein